MCTKLFRKKNKHNTSWILIKNVHQTYIFTICTHNLTDNMHIESVKLVTTYNDMNS